MSKRPAPVVDETKALTEKAALKYSRKSDRINTGALSKLDKRDIQDVITKEEIDDKLLNNEYESKHTLESDEEEEYDKQEKYRKLDTDNIEGQEEATEDYDGDVKITPFNLKEEEEEGHFDAMGNFVFNKKNEVIKDAWLDGIDWGRIKKDAGRKSVVKSSRKRKLTTLDVHQKIEILNALQSKNKTRKELSEEYGCDLSTIARIVQQELKIRSIAFENGDTSRKRFRKRNHAELDEALSIWFRQMKAKNAIINGPIIIKQGKKFAEELGITDFIPSNGWLYRWKTKENVVYRKIKGKEHPAEETSDTEWMREVFPSLLADYHPWDIYNADESGLYYKALPNEKLTVEGSKSQKNRLTVLFLCNMDGSDRKVYTIGQSKQPRCFRGKTIPIPYFVNNQSWMTCNVWTNILKDFDSSMAEQNRKILLFVDNASCHNLDEGVILNNVNLHFLPANSTTIVQPLNYGIIHTFKMHYRRLIVRKLLFALDEGLTSLQFAKSLNVLESLRLIERSWRLVPNATILNCFRKAGFLKFGVGDDKEVPEMKETEAAFHDYVNCDAHLECYGELSIEDILNEVRHQKRNQVYEEDEVQHSPSNPPNRKEALAALNVLRSYFIYNNIDLKNVNTLEDQLCDLSNDVEKMLFDYFK